RRWSLSNLNTLCATFTKADGLGIHHAFRIYVHNAERLSRLTQIQNVRATVITTTDSAKRAHSPNPARTNLSKAAVSRWPTELRYCSERLASSSPMAPKAQEQFQPKISCDFVVLSSTLSSRRWRAVEGFDYLRIINH